jgi:hypothetical protein
MLGYGSKLPASTQPYQSASDFNIRKNRALSQTTGQESQLYNSTKLPQLPQLGRSSSFSKSAKLKLTTIDAKLTTMAQSAQDLKMETRVLFDSHRNPEDIATFSKHKWHSHS